MSESLKEKNHVAERVPRRDHYTTGRRYSHISKTWILYSSWNDAEEIAMLKSRISALEAKVIPQ